MGREGEVMAELVREFEAEHPGLRVRVQQIPWTAAHEKLLTAHVGRATPDLALLGNTWIAEFVALDALVRLDPWIAASRTIDPDHYFRGIWDTNRVAGAMYGVPWYVDTRVIFYRTDILEAAGYDSMPGTWAEWREAMQRIKESAGPGEYPLFLPTNEWAPPVVLGMQNGAMLLRAGDRFGDFRAPEFRTAFDFYVDLYHAGLAPALTEHDVANPWHDLARGRFAMWVTGPWNIGELRSRLPAELQAHWSTAPLPGPNDRSSATSLAGGASLVVLRSSPHPSPAPVPGTALGGFRVFAGYAGWSAGQLAGEIEDGAWYVLDAVAADVFTTDPEGLWSRVLRRQGGDLAMLSTFPDDPTMN
jgi:multiple sugar transport system substrate-binding protein